MEGMVDLKRQGMRNVTALTHPKCDIDRVMTALASLNGDPRDILRSLATRSDTQQLWHLSASLWLRYRALAPADPLGHIKSATAFRELGHFAAADMVLTHGTAEFPADIEMALGHADVARIRGDNAEALSRFEAFHARFPQHLAGYVCVVGLLREAGRCAEALVRLREGLRLFPNRRELLREGIWISRQIGRSAEAELFAATLRRRFPEDPDGWVLGAMLARESGWFDAAETLLAHALVRFPDSQNTTIQSAWVAHAREDWPEALMRWERAVTRCPGDPVPYTVYGGLLRTLGRVEEARVILIDAHARFPDHAGILHELAQLPSQQSGQAGTAQGAG